MKAVLVVSHGSRSRRTKQELDDLIARLCERTAVPFITYAFLEIEDPSIPQGLEACRSAGADEVLVVLNFLNSGQHVDEDIPRIVAEYQKSHPEVLLKVSVPVGQHPGIVGLFADIIARENPLR